jgi:homoserine O-succinyltransferase
MALRIDPRPTAGARPKDINLPGPKEAGFAVPNQGKEPEKARVIGEDEGIVVALINNMPDAALEATERQFGFLLDAASGDTPITLRYSTLPAVPRIGAAARQIEESYWDLEELKRSHVDAIIVTGAEPKTATLPEEPYWAQMVDVLHWARNHTTSSLWSCLAAHAAVLELDGIARQRLPLKCCGVFEQEVDGGNILGEGFGAQIHTPHSRWNDLPISRLRERGYEMLSQSAEIGADIFVKRERSLLVFCQGHPEYEEGTLLREFQRDVSRYLNGKQENYPSLPKGTFSEEAIEVFSEFEEFARQNRMNRTLARFPGRRLADRLAKPWGDSAVRLYRNWIRILRDRGGPAKSGVS